METINRFTGAARNAISGGSNGTSTTQTDVRQDEPLSGQTENTEAGEPYDPGNIDPTNKERTTNTDNTDTTDIPTSGVASSDIEQTDTPGSTTNASNSGLASNEIKQTDAPGNTAATGPIRPEHDTDKTGVTSLNQPSNAFGSDRPSNSNTTSGSGPEPSVGADPTSAPQNTQKLQGADRPHEEPSSSEHEGIKAAKEEAEKAQDVDVSGPGPKPLSESKHAGDGPSSAGGDDEINQESHGSGTGEQYVKSSGMKADGGDFDAAKPGAGREADRLLEEKGIRREPGKAPGGDDKSDPLEDKINKPSLGQKIKAKLHKT